MLLYKVHITDAVQGGWYICVEINILTNKAHWNVWEPACRMVK